MPCVFHFSQLIVITLKFTYYVTVKPQLIIMLMGLKKNSLVRDPLSFHLFTVYYGS